MKKHLIVIGGATATGKTALALQLARHFAAPILSADSRQFYREMSIGTAKPTAAEQAEARHHFVDSLSVTEPYSVGQFEHDALKILTQYFENQDIAILVGGSGLYLRAVCEGLDAFPDIPPDIRAAVDEGSARGGLAWLRAQLAQHDPAYLAAVDQHNPARLRRALEVCLATGQPYSTFRSGERQPRAFVPCAVLLDLPRVELYARIEARVEAMLAAGLEAEARALLPYRHLPALRTVGYEEFFEYFDGKINYATAVDNIKQHSRNYAKRQATWFRKHGEWAVFHPNDPAAIVRYVEERLLER